MGMLRAVSVFVAIFLAAHAAGNVHAQNAAPSGQGHFTRGQLLVAAPHMPDPRFAETVIYMVDHDARGAFGLIINRPLGEGPMDDFMKGIGLAPGSGSDGKIQLFFGGPVDPGRVFVLHSAEWKSPDTISVRGPIAVTSDANVLKAIAEGNGPRRSLVILGYAGWGPQQLDGEMARDDWITAPLDFDLIFDGDPNTKWERASIKAGVAL